MANKNYIIGSHNSWSYLPPKHWWMRPFAFMAKCQSVDIKTQYGKYGVRCFDLRVLIDKNGDFCIAHGFMQYQYTMNQLLEDLSFLESKGDCFVRILHEARRKSQYTASAVSWFKWFCSKVLERDFPNTRFWCGRNLYNWEFDYDFGPEPSCHEDYSSVSYPKLIDDWFPWLYARFHNDEIVAKGTEREILLMDFVNIR